MKWQTTKVLPEVREDVTVLAINNRTGEMIEAPSARMVDIPTRWEYWQNPGIDYWHEWEIVAWAKEG